MNNLWRNAIGSIRLLSCLAALAVAEGTARGQPIGNHFDSIEWMVADSTLVVRGTIIAVKTEPKADYGHWQTVAFRVDETLKGKQQQQVQFVVDAGGSAERISRWRVDGHPLIVFLHDSRTMAARMAGSSGLSGRKYARFPFAPRSGYINYSFLELGPDVKTPAITLALRRLERPKEILQATQAAIAAPREPGNLLQCTIRLPDRGNLDSLTVPIDSRLETAARDWIKSKGLDMRVEGATALLYFQSKLNADLLEGLLDDPGFRIHGKEKAGRVVEEARIYPVREHAYDVLQAWGIDVASVIREPIPGEADRRNE